MLGHPERVSVPAIECRGSTKGRMEIIDRAWKAVLKESVGVDRGNEAFERARMGGQRRSRGGCRQ